MNRTTRIISKVLLIVGALALAGCKITTPDWGKYRGTNPHPHVVINNKPISHDELNGNLEQIEQEGDDYENIYKGQDSKSGISILPSKFLKIVVL